MSSQEPIPAGPLSSNPLHALRESGYDVSALALHAGLSPDALEGEISPAEADRFLCITYQATGDPAIGLWLGSRMRPEFFGLAGTSVMSSPSFGTALRRIARDNALMAGDRMEVRQHGNEAWVYIRQTGPDQPYTRSRIDMELCSLLAFGRLFTRKPLQPVQVSLRIGQPAWHQRYADAFDCPVRFGQAEDAIVFGRQDLSLRRVNAGIGSAHAPHTGEASTHDAIADMRAALQRLANDRCVSLTAVASQLCVSERTLQRRLATAGTSFRELYDDVRGELAKQCLADATQSLGEIAFRLGFDDANSFFRAFRRWTGTTPGSFRQSVSAGERHD